MQTAHEHVGRHALIYYVLAFAISWTGVLFIIGADGIPGTPEEFSRLILPVVFAMLAGPSVAGIVSSAALHGRRGLGELGASLRRWRVGGRWYLIAGLLAPVVVATTIFSLARASDVYRPGIVAASDPTAHLLMGLSYGLIAGLFEEIGWTGFAIPEIRRRVGVFATGAIVGVLWGMWHLLVIWWGAGGSAGNVPMSLYLAALLFAFLVPYRLLMVWVYERTRSLPVAMLMHAALTGSVRVFDPLTIGGTPLVVYNVLIGVGFSVLVLIVALAGGFASRTDRGSASLPRYEQGRA